MIIEKLMCVKYGSIYLKNTRILTTLTTHYASSRWESVYIKI